MFQTLTLPSRTQTLPISLTSSPIPTSLRFSRRAFPVRCRAATAEDFFRCVAAGSLYEVLKIKQSASAADIKKAYRRMAKIHHPDASSSPDGCEFIQIRDAYETLSDPMARSAYDVSIGRRRSSFSTFSSSTSVGRRPGYQQSRRWESDQCW